LRKSSAASRSRSSPESGRLKGGGLRDFLLSLALLGLALLLSLGAESASQRAEALTAGLLAALALSLALAVSLFLVPKLWRRVDLRGWRLPVLFRITAEGALFILLVLLVLLGALNTGNNLLFLVLSSLLSAMVVSGIVARTSLRALTISIHVPEHVFVGETVSLKVSLRNQKRLFPSFSLSVTDTSTLRSGGVTNFLKRWRRSAGDPGQDDSVLRQAAYFPIVGPRQARSELVFQSYPARGLYRLGGFAVQTRFPFGFFLRGEHIHAAGDLVVYPQIREVSSYYHLLPFLTGHLEGLQRGTGENLYAIRVYQEGESARTVDWKASAKTGVLMAREYARDEEQKFCLILDASLHPVSSPDSEAEFEKAVSLAAGLASHFCDEGAELEFVTQSEYVRWGMGPPQLYGILRALALVKGVPAGKRTADLRAELGSVLTPLELDTILSEKIFKIILTSKPRGSFPAAIWRSSHVIYFDEL